MLATVTDGRLTKVTGDPDNPMFKGYTCPKGRALPEIHNNPQRLLHSQKRRPTARYAPIEAERAMDEIAAKLQQSDRHARAALGRPLPRHQRSALSGIRADGECVHQRHRVADVLHRQHHRPAGQADRHRRPRHWLGGDVDFHEADSWMLIGTNPVISKAIGIRARTPPRS